MKKNNDFYDIITCNKILLDLRRPCAFCFPKSQERFALDTVKFHLINVIKERVYLYFCFRFQYYVLYRFPPEILQKLIIISTPKKTKKQIHEHAHARVMFYVYLSF